jgi:hypothetical protein
MYQDHDEVRSERRRPDGPTRISPEARARHALAHIEQALTTGAPALDPSRLRAALAVPLADPALEQQRAFSLGWLAWLDGDFPAARTHLTGASGARAAYWLARVRLLAGDIEGLSAFEQQMRSFQGSPQATCWFVDLLWRAARHDRALQVWKSVRLNKRVAACEEAVLLEARAFIAQDDLAAAEKALQATTPQNGVLQAERHLLLAWLTAARQITPEQPGPLPSLLLPVAARRAWERLLLRDDNLSFEDLQRLSFSPPVRVWIQAQHSRTALTDPASILASLEIAATLPRLTAYVRYARAMQGQTDFAAVLAGLPGAFLAGRCRLWQALTRFCRREASAAELLGVFEQARRSDHGTVGLEPWQQLAQGLADPAITPESLWESASASTGKPRWNWQRAAVELALKRWPAEVVSGTLLTWGRELLASDDTTLKRFVGRELLRRLLDQSEPARKETLTTVEGLLGEAELPSLVRATQAPTGATVSERIPAEPLARIWQAALMLARGEGKRCRDALRGEIDNPLARCLLTFEAATRGDQATLLGLLEPSPAWQRLTSGPPRFVCRALAQVPASERWREALARWLGQWLLPSPGPELQALAVRAGLVSARPDAVDIPPSADAPWLLHQASLALGRQDPATALGWMRRAEQVGLQGLSDEQRRIVESALPDLERLARASLLALVTQLDPAHPVPPAGLFVDFVDLLNADLPDVDLLGPAAGGKLDLARERMAVLADRESLPPRLANHLALVFLRAAGHFEGQDRDADAASCWRRAWHCWLLWAAAAEPAHVALLLDHLLARHRERLKELLARNAVAQARPLWEVLHALPARLPPGEAGSLLRQRLETFRDELATAFLLDTRQSMRHGAIPEGWRADYEQGLARLRRLLSLDRDNPRLLTALVEICADWFLDLYDLRDEARLREEVERFTPFALQLVRAVSKDRLTSPEVLAARGALSEFFKFRAFVTSDPERKRALYREALALNPANDNVRELLGKLEERRP